MSTPTPPKFLTRLLQVICKEEYYEELQGDLEERFVRDVEQKNVRRARRTYNLEMLKLLRPSVIKFPKLFRSINHWSIFKNYSLVAFRNLRRQKLFSAINITGLAISMAVGLITISFITEMEGYDQFHANLDRLYRISTVRTNHLNSSSTYASTSLKLGDRLTAEFGGTEEVVQIYKGLWGDLGKADKLYSFMGLYTTDNFFRVFSFDMISGDPFTALTEPNSMVLTEKLAMKIFNSLDIIGETVQKGDITFTVTGIANNPPRNSHMKFDALASLSTIRNMENYDHLYEWGTMWSSYVYVLLPERHNLNQLKANLSQIAAEENAQADTYSMSPQPIAVADIFPGDGEYNQIGSMLLKSYINQVIILALIVLFSACFNYANLSMAKSLKRAREIGIRKVIGARKSQLFSQFVLEAVIVSLISLLFAFGLFIFFRPYFINLDYTTIQTTTLELTPLVVVYFVLFAIIIGILAGIIPSLMITRFNPLVVLKGLSIKGDRGVSVRKVMVGIQFTLSIGLATLVYLTHQQYQHALNFDLGFTTENILNLETQGNNLEVLESAISQIPEVQKISKSAFIPSIGNTNSDHARLIDQTDSLPTYCNYIDENYLDNLNHKLLAGSNFSNNNSKDGIIVNETFLKKFGIQSPEEALGKRIHYYQSNKTIIGVVADFNYGTIYTRIEPFAFLYNTERLEHLNLKIQSSNIIETMDKLDKIWRQIDPHHELNATFYDVQIQGFYKHMEAKMKMYGMLALIAISIAMLGLLGMVVYTTESRLKEITIRKVLGATLSNLIILVGRSFSWIFLIATSIAIPASYYVYQELIGSAVHSVDINLFQLAFGAIPIIVISLLVVFGQSLKAAHTNPADTLRNE